MKLKILLLVAILAILTKIGMDFAAFNKKYENKIYPGVFVDNLDFSGQTRDQVRKLYDEKTKKLGALGVTVFYKNDPVATFSAKTLNLKYDGETPSIQAYMVGRSKHIASRYLQLISAFFKIKEYRFESALSYDQEPVKEFLGESEEKYNHPAENALFKFESGRVISFKNEKKGLELESEKFLTDFDSNIQNLKKNKFSSKVEITGKIIQPEITLASSNKFGIEEEIATGKSDYSHSIPERIHNVILAASKFNGVLIPPGETFSFNKTIGDISSLTGYKPAYIIKEGKTVLGDGGGVCQVSTTLFRAALLAGLPIIERHAHAYRVSYYENDSPPGFDATVYSPTVDLKIKNDTPSHILIETEVDEQNMLLYFRFFGKKDGRAVQIANTSLWDVTAPLPAKYQDDATLKKGVVKQVDFPAWGSKASFTYKVNGGKNANIDEKFYSYYKPWAPVYLVGTAD